MSCHRRPPRNFLCSTWYASHGVIVNATTIDISMATGTFSAIGAMYGPIMPVMKNIGRKLTITASVALIERRADLGDGLEHDVAGGPAAHREVPRDVLDVHDRVVHQQAEREDQGKQGHAVDRVAEEEVDTERQAEDDRHGDRDDKRLAPAEAQGQ